LHIIFKERNKIDLFKIIFFYLGLGFGCEDRTKPYKNIDFVFASLNPNTKVDGKAIIKNEKF
jgi:hypothetical protein